ncbi:hypothetical protein SprV_0401561400 [Sparganum proliferum]
MRSRMPTGGLTIASSSPRCGFISTHAGDLNRLADLPVAATAAADENAFVENRCCQLQDTVRSTALAVLGRARRQHQDWFDDNDSAICNLLAEKNRLHKAYVDRLADRNKAAFYRSRRLVQQRLLEMQVALMAHKAEEIQGAKGSTLLTEKTEILQRWAKHFKGVLNRPSIPETAIARLPQEETNVDVDLRPSPRNHQGRVAALQRKSARIGRDPC